ncbi:MAG: hypothetical protein ABI824_02730 [Acidobacteriota bacterium]
MPKAESSKLSVRQFAEQYRGEMISLSDSISYYCAASESITEEDLKEYLQEPIAALPPSVSATLPKLSILLVPYLERDKDAPKSSAKAHGSAAGEYVSEERPPEGRISASAQLSLGDQTVLAFALKDREMAEYHYRLYQSLATVLGAQWSADADAKYTRLIREELTADVHGEVDEASWRVKQTLRRSKSAGSTQNFRKYVQQSFVDTLTLYLHGICCDIDVDTGPRQLPSRFLRKRLLLLEELFPPPKGYAVFPEQLGN